MIIQKLNYSAWIMRTQIPQPPTNGFLDEPLGLQVIGAAVVIVTILVLVIGIKVADSVVKPIQKLTRLALKLSTDNVKKSASEIDTDFDKELMEQDDEIGELTRAFQNLIFKVREDAQKEDD